MTPGIGFALGAMVFFGIGDLIYKRAAASGIGAREFVMFQAWVFCPGVTLYAWLTGTLDPHWSAVWGALAGLCVLVALYNFAASLKAGAVSTNAPIFRLNFTITAAIAIVLLGETLTLAKFVALACSLAAVWLLLAEPGNVRARTPIAALARVLMATAAMGLANLFYKIGLQHHASPETMVSAQAWAFCSTATLFAWLPQRRIVLRKNVWRYSIPVAAIQIAGFLLLLHGLVVGPASVLVPVAQMGFVFTAVLGAVMFGETLTARKRLGLVVAVAALGLFAVA